MIRVLIVSGLLATAALPANAAGRLRICRYPPSASSVSDRKAVPIPAGTVFTSGDNPKTGDQLKPYFTVRTTADVTLPPKPGCVSAPAVMGENANGFRLTPRYPVFLPSQMAVPGASIVGRVVSDFGQNR